VTWRRYVPLYGLRDVTRRQCDYLGSVEEIYHGRDFDQRRGAIWDELELRGLPLA
tara:strand:+ start:216 stop:380 length:165 start_codon:yes stop_codon:yes gene_type:complete